MFPFIWVFFPVLHRQIDGLIWISFSFPGSQFPGFPVSRVPSFPGSQFPGSQFPGFPGSRVPSFPGSQFPGSQFPGFPVSRVPRFPGSQVPGFPGSRVPRFPGSQVPRFLYLFLFVLFTCKAVYLYPSGKEKPMLAHRSHRYILNVSWYYYQISVRYSFKYPFRRSLVLASQTTNIILVHLKQFCFHHLKTIKLLWPFLVLQRNDHSLYVRILLFYLKSSMTCFITNTFFFKFLI